MSAPDDKARVLVVGNPNAGKTTLFNALSGARAKVGNYPGVTVTRNSQVVEWTRGSAIELIDVPGTYSLSARSPEEQVAIGAIFDRDQTPDAVIVTVDASAIVRNLYLALQIIEAGLPVVIALTMMDAVEARGERIDAVGLAENLGVPVVPVVATKNKGLAELKTAVEQCLSKASKPGSFHITYPEWVEDLLQGELHQEVAAWLGTQDQARIRAASLWCLLSLGGDDLRNIPENLRNRAQLLRRRTQGEGRDLDEAIISARYAFIENCQQASTTEIAHARSWTERFDSLLTHRVWGLLIFASVMLVLFEALFTWSEPFISMIEGVIGWLQGRVRALIPAGVFSDLLAEGIIAGVGNVLVFVPQILLLFLFIGFLEDSGYLARVAFVIDRLMKGVGLHGKAFVPLLSGFACAVPAVMATRTIEHRRDRLATMLALPLMSCSARLPVYVLIIATVFAGQTRIAGVFSPGSLALFAMYALSVAATLFAASVLRRTVFRGPRPALVLELPSYRWPIWKNLWLGAWRRLRVFLVDAGTIIFALTIVLWALLSFPQDEAIAERYAALRAHVVQVQGSQQAEVLDNEALNRLDQAQAADELAYSIGGRIGRAIEPILEPIGLDWRLGVGVLGAFAAREVFVSTLGIVFGVGDSDEESVPLRQALKEAKRPDGSPLLTPLVGLSLMVFFVFACQCMSTIAAVWRESGSWRWPLLMFVYMSALAYIAALFVYQVGLFFGWGVA